MAVEAARKKDRMIGEQIESFCLRETRFSKALLILDTLPGAEVSLILEPLRHSPYFDSKTWNKSRVLSYGVGRRAIQHCQGIISVSCEL